MSFINIRDLAQLTNSSKVQKGYEATADTFFKKYNLKLQHEDLQNLVETATRINKREKGKQTRRNKSQTSQQYEIFVFGQLKVFNWVLVLYSHINNLSLQQYDQNHLNKIQSIFKKKSKLFIRYQIQDLIFSRQKHSKEWVEPEIELLKQIIKYFWDKCREKQNQSEWKSVSYSLFAKSEGLYFKSFSMCREKWISHLNPNIKKTDWNFEEDVELFNMIKNYGCRWALISREMKGIRSEHSVKNRYHVLVKTIKRQYRLGDTNQLNDKILKYLKMKLQKQKESEIDHNSSGFSNDSKFSRERSREEEKNKLNFSKDSHEQDGKFTLFGEINYLEPPNTDSPLWEEANNYNLPMRDYYCELKEEKKTNDHEDEDQEPHKLTTCLMELQNQESSSVKPSTLEQLEIEFNRLLNYSEVNKEPKGFFLDYQNRDNYGHNGNSWFFEQQDRPISWSDLDQ